MHNYDFSDTHDRTVQVLFDQNTADSDTESASSINCPEKITTSISGDINEQNHRVKLDAQILEFFDLTCPKCEEHFLTFTTMINHQKSVHGEKGFVMCCGRQLFRREAVMEHIENHLHPNKFT